MSLIQENHEFFVNFESKNYLLEVTIHNKPIFELYKMYITPSLLNKCKNQFAFKINSNLLAYILDSGELQLVTCTNNVKKEEFNKIDIEIQDGIQTIKNYENLNKDILMDILKNGHVKIIYNDHKYLYIDNYVITFYDHNELSYLKLSV
jgi:hypothetical protein